MTPVIECQNLTKKYRTLRAVDTLSLKIRAGEIYGFLGLNGAGKTTTIRMLLGMVKASSGQCHLFGTSICSANNLNWNRVGYLVETPNAYPEMTVAENLELMSNMRRLKGDGAREAIMNTMGLDRYQKVKARHLSLGNAQRLGLAKAMIHNPELLILDEPSNGLDPAGIVEIRKHLLDLAHKQGKTIFVSSHILGEVARFADRIGIIHRGKLIRELDIETLKDIHQRRLLIDTVNNSQAQHILKHHGFSIARTSDGLLETRDEKALAEPEQLAELLVTGHCPLRRLEPAEEDLETFFLRTISEAEGQI